MGTPILESVNAYGIAKLSADKITIILPLAGNVSDHFFTASWTQNSFFYLKF